MVITVKNVWKALFGSMSYMAFLDITGKDNSMREASTAHTMSRKNSFLWGLKYLISVFIIL